MSKHYQEELDLENKEAQRLQVGDLVRTPLNIIGRVVEFDTGYLNIKVGFTNGEAWFNDAELTTQLYEQD